LTLSDFDRQMLVATGQELMEERDAVASMFAR
jgi:hypothetical protein